MLIENTHLYIYGNILSVRIAPSTVPEKISKFITKRKIFR